jgi:hypothetical protein
MEVRRTRSCSEQQLGRTRKLLYLLIIYSGIYDASRSHETQTQTTFPSFLRSTFPLFQILHNLLNLVLRGNYSRSDPLLMFIKRLSHLSYHPLSPWPR